MYELTLEWQDTGQLRQETIRHQQGSKYPGTVRIGRNPAECDIILSDPTVSGLHVEIFFNLSTQAFFLRNLRYSNPPVVDNQQLITGEVALRQGSIIYLGQLELKITTVSLPPPSSSIPLTILLPPQPSTQPQDYLTPVYPHRFLPLPLRVSFRHLYFNPWKLRYKTFMPQD